MILSDQIRRSHRKMAASLIPVEISTVHRKKKLSPWHQTGALHPTIIL